MDTVSILKQRSKALMLVLFVLGKSHVTSLVSRELLQGKMMPDEKYLEQNQLLNIELFKISCVERVQVRCKKLSSILCIVRL